LKEDECEGGKGRPWFLKAGDYSTGGLNKNISEALHHKFDLLWEYETQVTGIIPKRILEIPYKGSD
jgi:hypothetical protein